MQGIKTLELMYHVIDFSVIYTSGGEIAYSGNNCTFLRSNITIVYCTYKFNESERVTSDFY